MDDIFDEMLLLSPEQLNYNQGLADGKKISYNRNVREGKQYGLMIGFQKFLIVGQLEEVVKGILSECSEIDSRVQLKKQCNDILELLGQIEMSDNESSTVEKNDALLLKVKNKLKLILMVYNRKSSGWLSYDKILDVYNLVGNSEMPATKSEDYYADETISGGDDEQYRQNNVVDGTNTEW